ncbi:hypothetical protein NDU88_007864 [Pleurodeles waltl]|uniref:Uncharacterized protein n=1 Tax=Pleurodeles waltl TaxID=8319 RepID=A0AAV7NXH2_PLEWA|nr:hypothetical protein NDU88_007864 [Pleurodeles waltl]
MSTKQRSKGKPQWKNRDGDPTQSDMAIPIPPSLQDTLDEILGAIEECKTTLQREIGQVSVELGLLRADYQKLADRVRCAEATFTDIAPRWCS